MGRSWLVLLALLAGCSDRYGAYFVVDGHDDIAFDRVEFYFGQDVGMKVPVPPGHTVTEPEPGLLLRRQLADRDVTSLAAPSHSLTYFVPPGDTNRKLGDYVLAIAYAGNDRVGIAELFDFAIPTEEVVYRYELPLVPYGSEAIELWGRPTQDCIRWKRDRGSRPALVAMTRSNDADCDAFVDRDDQAADCEPLRYCDGTGNAGCIGASACVTLDDNGCRIGTCQNKDGQQASCAATSCAIDAACTVCDLDAPPRELLDCVLLGDGTHLDYPVVVKPSQALCSEPYKLQLVLPTGVTCVSPKIEAAVNWMPGEPFNYQIASAGSTCLLTMSPPMPGAVFEGVPHMMVSVDSPAGPPSRLTFIFGLSTTVDACSTEQTVVIEPSTVPCVP